MFANICQNPFETSVLTKLYQQQNTIWFKWIQSMTMGPFGVAQQAMEATLMTSEFEIKQDRYIRHWRATWFVSSTTLCWSFSLGVHK